MKKKQAKEPQTDDEFLDALHKLGCEFIDTGDGFVVQSKRGGQTRLESEDYTSALFEAWSLMK